MIVKLIRMNRRQRRASNSFARRRKLQRLRQAVFALTRYVVDADPYSLIEAEHDILSISDYALAAECLGVEPGEKVEAFGCRNLVSSDLAAWQAQMLAVAARAPKVKSPVLHIVLSLRENEEWNAREREEAIDIVLQTLRLDRCPVVWAEHGNTPNPHLHLSVVRVDPRTGQAAGSDWLIDDLHQAAALVVERQGRAREPGALVPGDGFRAEVRRIEPSPRFQAEFGKPRDVAITPTHSIGKLVPIGRKMTRPTTLMLTDLNGNQHECVGEAFDTTYNILVLVYPIKSLSATTIILN